MTRLALTGHCSWSSSVSAVAPAYLPPVKNMSIDTGTLCCVFVDEREEAKPSWLAGQAVYHYRLQHTSRHSRKFKKVLAAFCEASIKRGQRGKQVTHHVCYLAVASEVLSESVCLSQTRIPVRTGQERHIKSSNQTENYNLYLLWCPMIAHRGRV